ncbi:hypothetical protein [Sphingomonas sp. SUN039]|uniref:hypothetical protein n=1 Tax=Sphingomonas sp. SUN039 TaxID=2937787 RepID=UPI0021642C6E|nr:hypothetical protein [Sphingomonas sp. SUN039]UVO54424.1 hypothetical protein M0209_09925 [Sphingomonas sp. SUN039]
MNDFRSQIDGLKNAAKPWLFSVDWPEHVAVNSEAIRAAVFAGEATKKTSVDIFLVREDNRFLNLAKIGKSWRAASGEWAGNGSIIDSEIVRTDHAGRPMAPKKGIVRLLPGNGAAEFSWRDALDIGLHFVELGNLPLGFAWWRAELVK